MCTKNIPFYFDESFHSRKINESTIKSEEYFDNYICVGLGFKDLEKDMHFIKEFEQENKKRLSIGENVELKSSVVKKNQYKYGLSTFNKKSLELYMTFWGLLNTIDIIPYMFVSNKLEYILKQTDLHNYNFCYSEEALIYTIVKAINVYRPSKVLSMLLNGDKNFLVEIRKFFEQKIEENKNNPIKERENLAYIHVIMILNTINTESIIFEWNYKYIFYGLQALLYEKKINMNNVKIYIDREGEKNNTYEKCLESGFKNVFEFDSKESIEIRCSDLLCGFVGKMMRAIYEDTKYTGDKYDKKNRLSKEWFNVNEKQFDLYKLISNTIRKKFSNYWSTCVSIYFDIFLEFMSIVNYFNLYNNYAEYKKYNCQEHVEKFEKFLLANMMERFKNYF